MTKAEKRDRIKAAQKQLANIRVGKCETDHAWNGRGGKGISAYVWVTLDYGLATDKRRKLHKFVVSGAAIDLAKVTAAIEGINGYVSHYVNLD